MYNFPEYLLKTGISLTVFYLFYWLVMRKDTHFYLNRSFLLISVILSLLLPLIHTGIIKTSPVLAYLPSISLDIGDPGVLNSPGHTSASVVSGASPVNYRNIIILIYLIGACIVLARLIYQGIFLHAVARLSNKIKYKGYTIVCMHTDMIPFSYFKRIYIPSERLDESSFDSIVAHERSHLSQWHYIDLFIVEIVALLQWFNPVAWFYEKSIKEIHEYLADEAVLNSGKNQGKYQALLVNQAIGGPVFILTNQFNQSLIKKRIIMMKKMKSSRTAQLKALFIVPLIVALLMAFNGQQLTSKSLSGGKAITVTGSITDRSTGKPVTGSVVMIKGTTEGTLALEDGSYQIIVENTDAILVFSHIGYHIKDIQVGSNSRINVQLEPDILVLDFSKPRDLDVKDHGEIIEKVEGSYVVTEEYPTYPGGMDALLAFLKSNMHYPSEARDKGIEGKVMVNFTINEKGDVENAKVLLGVSPELDAEALRLTNSMRGWIPAAQNGKPISTSVNMPIEFKIK